jgi:sulfatase modifying factor 1
MKYLHIAFSIAFLSSVGCGRSDPIPCTDKCENPGDTRCNGSVLQVCADTDSRCTKWQDWVDCSYYDQACTESGGSAECSKTCSDACTAEGDTRCSSTVIQTCALGEKGCLGWVSGTDCSVYDEVCDMEEGQARCTVVCEDECTIQGSTKCGGTFILTCARDYYGCLYWEYGRDCANDGLICDDTGGFATCGPCVPDCSGRLCGPDPVCGQSCGTCMGTTEVCRLYTGQCEDVCNGKDCGTFDGIYCGDCEGPTEICRELSGECEDVCQWRECGITEGIDCGTCTGGENCIAGQCFVPICEDGMCQVPAGTFMMGCNEEVDLFCRDNERPSHEVYLDSFEIDQFEVTQAQYFLCALEGACQFHTHIDPELHGDDPVYWLYWDDTRAYCEWAGKRLCTEAEWEKAARGADGRRYPWGNEPASCDYAVMNDGGAGCGTGAVMPVGSKLAGASPYGALDMAGNVWEYVSDYYSDTYYSECTEGCSNPQGPPTADDYRDYHVLKGGDIQCWASWVRASFRAPDNFGPSWEGFRCCR